MTKAAKCAKDIMSFLDKHDLSDGVSIYYDKKRVRKVKDSWITEYDLEPKQFFPYAGDFLSMSFEGTFYDVVNYGFEHKWYAKLEKEFSSIIKKHGKYYELGNAWNLSLYDL